MFRLLNLIGSTVCLTLVLGLFFATTSGYAQTLSPEGEGRRAWLKYNCYGCHGIRAQGGMGPNVQHESGEVGEAVLEGKDEGMPSYSQILTSEDVTNLRAYLRSIGRANEPMFTHWWEPIPTK